MKPAWWRDYHARSHVDGVAWNDPAVKQHQREHLEDQVQRALNQMRKTVNRLGLPLVVKWNPVTVTRIDQDTNGWSINEVRLDLQVSVYFETEADKVLYELSEATAS